MPDAHVRPALDSRVYSLSQLTCEASQDNRTGKEFTAAEWGKAEGHSSGIVFDVGRKELQALLPEGYIIDPDVQPTVLHEILNMRKIPWLAGRGKVIDVVASARAGLTKTLATG